MRIFFLAPYPGGESPSQRFRFEQYFGLLSTNNIEFNVSSFWGRRAWRILYRRGHIMAKIFWLSLGFAKRGIDVFRSIPYDLIFVHRECAPVGPPLVEFVLTKILQKKVIYDFDDAIWLDNTSHENHLARWIKFHGKVKLICQWSHAVSCGNEWLADFAKQFNANVVVNPTTIDTLHWHNPERWPIRRKEEKIVIGWTGTQSTIGFLDQVLPVLQSIEKKFSVVVRVISNKDPKLKLTSFEYVRWQKQSEIADLLTFDIGIMPLSDDDWSRGKCGFKALQYMALGIPCVASPVGVNKSIISNNVNGFLCASSPDWEISLGKLIQDESLRKQIGAAARKRVVDYYSVDSNSSNFLSLTRS
jgi:glycosyltransferase involved in cell wall biosynthesis